MTNSRPAGSWQQKTAGIKPPAAPAPAPGAPTQQPSPGVSGAAPTGQQYPVAPGSYAPNPGGATPTGTKYDIDPTGKMTPFTPYQSGPGETSYRAGEGTDLFDLNMQRLAMMLKQFGMVGGPQAALPREVPGAAPGREVPSTMADRVPAEAAAFGRAKDRIGDLGGGAMMALKDRSTAGGRSGSGLEAKDRRGIVRETQSQLGEVVRDQAIDSLDRADQIDDRNLATGVAQRGQDLGTRAGDQASNVQQRGQDYNALLNPYQNPLLSSMAPTLFGSFMPRLY